MGDEHRSPVLFKVEEGKDLEFEMYLTRRSLDFLYSFDGCERCKTVKVKEVSKKFLH